MAKRYKNLEDALKEPNKVAALVVDLEQNKVTENNKIVASLSQLPNLSDLTIKAEACEIPEALGRIKKLKRLRLELLDCGEDPIPNSLGALTSLQKLEIERSEITKIPASIGDLINLRELFLSQTSIQEIPASIERCQDLETIDCTECHDLAKIPPGIGALKKLRTLRLNGMFATVPSELCNLSLLEEVDLDGKFLAIPAGLADLPVLKKIYIRGRFGEIDFAYLESSPAFDRESFRAQISAFNADSKAAFDAYAASVNWPIFLDPGEAQKRPLKGIPVYSSFKQAALPGEEIFILPATSKHKNAFKALTDGTPVVFLSQSDSNTTLNGHLNVGVLIESGQENYDGTYKLKCATRVSLLAVRSENNILLADIDTYGDTLADNTGLSEEDITQKVRPKLEAHLRAIRTPKGSLAKALESFDRGVGQAIRTGTLSFFIAAKLPTAYEIRQKLLLITNEKERLSLLDVA